MKGDDMPSSCLVCKMHSVNDDYHYYYHKEFINVLVLVVIEARMVIILTRSCLLSCISQGLL